MGYRLVKFLESFSVVSRHLFCVEKLSRNIAQNPECRETVEKLYLSITHFTGRKNHVSVPLPEKLTRKQPPYLTTPDSRPRSRKRPIFTYSIWKSGKQWLSPTIYMASPKKTIFTYFIWYTVNTDCFHIVYMKPEKADVHVFRMVGTTGKICNMQNTPPYNSRPHWAPIRAWRWQHGICKRYHRCLPVYVVYPRFRDRLGLPQKVSCTWDKGVT